jgi:hypothetical protein
VVALVAVCSAVVPAGAQSSDVVLAVIRGRALQPIARFDGRTWEAPGVSARWPRQWLRWSFPASGSQSVTAALRQADSRCSAPGTMVLESVAGAKGDEASVAVATSAAAPVMPVRAVIRGSRPWNAAASSVAPLFESGARRNGISPPVLARVTAVVDAMYVSENGGAPVYYLESSKRVPDAGGTPPEDPKGVVRLTLSGWFRVEGQRMVPAATKTELHWDAVENRAMAAAPMLEPLAILREPARDLWVMQSDVAGQKSYALYAVTQSAVRVLVSTEAAQC